MAMSVSMCKEALNYYKRGFFNDINSVLDMGDQDLNVPYKILADIVGQTDLKLNEQEFERARHLPERPRVSTSAFWKLLGIKDAERMDIAAIERVSHEDQKSVLIKDLNEPLSDKNLWGKYDMVTDFGNNEHPFNIVEAYRTMHRLTSKNGYMWILQQVYGGNGFYNLDQPFFENLAVANNYEIIDSAYTISPKTNEDYSIPCEYNLLKMIDFSKAANIGIKYIFRKTNTEDFKFPYQGSGPSKPDRVNIYYKQNISIHENSFLVRNYIPHSINNLSARLLFSELIRRIKNKFLRK